MGQLFKNTYFIALAFVCVAIYAVYNWLQPVYSYQQLSRQFDAHQYQAVYQYLAGQRPDFSVSFPFNARLLAPYAASLVSSYDSVSSFQWVNAISILAALMLLLYFWSAQKLHLAAIGVGALFFVVHWKGPVRLYLPDPITADGPGYFLFTLWLVQMSRFTGQLWQWIGLVLVAVLGTLQKEAFIVIAGISMAWWVGRQKRQQLPLHLGWPITIIGITVLTRLVANQYFPPFEDGWQQNSPVTVLRAIWTYFRRPQQVLLVPMRWLIAYGVFWIGVPLTEPRKDLVFYLALTGLILSAIGGGDTSRIAITFLPAILTVMLKGVSASASPARMAVLVFLATLPLTRFWELEPDLGRFPQQRYQWCVECWSLAETGLWATYVLLTGWVLYLNNKRQQLRLSESE